MKKGTSRLNPISKNATTKTEAARPRFALAIATAFGLGYFPKAPGTFGSLAGILLAWLLLKFWPHTSLWDAAPAVAHLRIPYIIPAVLLVVSVGLLGLWTASRAAEYLGSKDPQVVVVDEVSGQLLAILFTFGSTERYLQGMTNFHDGFWWRGDVNWKYLLAGFILFRDRKSTRLNSSHRL